MDWFWSTYEATREGAGEQKPRSSLALLVHRVPGPTCSQRPDDSSGDGPQQPATLQQEQQSSPHPAFIHPVPLPCPLFPRATL